MDVLLKNPRNLLCGPHFSASFCFQLFEEDSHMQTDESGPTESNPNKLEAFQLELGLLIPDVACLLSSMIHLTHKNDNYSPEFITHV